MSTLNFFIELKLTLKISIIIIIFCNIFDKSPNMLSVEISGGKNLSSLNSCKFLEIMCYLLRYLTNQLKIKAFMFYIYTFSNTAETWHYHVGISSVPSTVLTLHDITILKT